MCKKCEDEETCCLCLSSDSEDDHQDVRLEQLRRALHHFYPPDGDRTDGDSEEQSDGGPDDDDSEEQSDGDPDDDDSEEQGSDGYS